jgi:serine/threonine protein kinase
MNPGTKLGPFIIETELGSGAMGTVYRAQYKDTAQKVAIKMMAPGIGTSETARARFERESAILKQLRHQNIVRLLATGRFKNSPFYAMEYIEGESLDHVMLRRGKMTWEEVVELGQQLCAALQHAHEQGIVHRDLKPSNLMMLSDGTVKLTDFGIAKDLDLTGLTATNCTVGTASYMSPEQCRGDKDISSKSDLYSMGVMFYELITGRKPFEAESTMDMFLQHVKGTFERPSRFVMELPIWLDTLICQLLEKKPEDRPFNAETVARSLADIKDKVEAQQSAGMDRVTLRSVDRKSAPRIDAEDKEAARALMRKGKSKSKKKKTTPIHQQNWFQIAGIAVVLLGMAFLFYYVFIMPPSLESLHKRAKVLMEEKNYAEALRDPIASFKTNYKESNDGLAKDLRLWANQSMMLQLENQIFNRKKLVKEADGNEERIVWRALTEEDVGNLEEAEKSWSALTRGLLADWSKIAEADEETADKHAYGLVAEKYIKQIQEAKERRKALEKKLGVETTFKGNSPEEEIAVKALKAEMDKNVKNAEVKWEDLKLQTKNDRDQRMWYLMAVSSLRELKMQSPPENSQ